MAIWWSADMSAIIEVGQPITVESRARVVVDKWRAWDMAPKTDGYEWHQLEAALTALEAELVRIGQ